MIQAVEQAIADARIAAAYMKELHAQDIKGPDAAHLTSNYIAMLVNVRMMQPPKEPWE